MIGNKTAEKDIRDFLSSNGYYGNSAKFIELEIHAIKRPGWLQVFRFTVEAKSVDDQWVTLFGAMKDDERFKLNEIQLFQNFNRRGHQLSTWSEGLLKPKNGSENRAAISSAAYIKEAVILVLVIGAVLLILSLSGLE